MYFLCFPSPLLLWCVNQYLVDECSLPFEWDLSFPTHFYNGILLLGNLSVCVSICVSMSVSLCVCVSVCQYICQYVCQSVSLSVCL